MPKPIPKKNSPHWHYDFVRNGRRFHGTTGTGNKRDAQAIIDQKLHEALLPDDDAHVRVRRESPLRRP